MQDLATVSAEGAAVPKPTKKKSSTQKAPKLQTQSNSMKRVHEVMHPEQTQMFQKGSKRSIKNDAPEMLQQPEKSTSDSLPDSSVDNEYRSLRRKYLILEEERFSLGRELTDIQDATKSLEEEKLSLLDDLVVMEGLIDPLDLVKARQRFS